MLDDNDIQKLSEVFVTKEDIRDFATKNDITNFKDEILKGQDEILQKLNPLTDEKTIKDGQDKRQKKALEIHNNAFKKK